MKRIVSGLFFVVSLLCMHLVVANAAAKAPGDTYFGTLQNIDAAHGVLTVAVQNVNQTHKLNQVMSFSVGPQTDVHIRQADGKSIKHRTINDVYGTRWVWVRSADGATATQVVATIYQAFEGRVTAINPGGPSLLLKVGQHWVGERSSGVSKRNAPRNFFVAPGTPCVFKKKRVDISTIQVGMKLKIVTNIDGTNAIRIIITGAD